MKQLKQTKQSIAICESCISAVKSGHWTDVDDDTAEVIAVEFGGEIPDHNCETIDNPELDRCDCNCH